jgi:murein DD-endopeptidase MepM/ murein hydrolase activator NlpD
MLLYCVVLFLLPMNYTQSKIQLSDALAQIDHPRFLSTPYYGSKSWVNSVFDHQIPNYTTDTVIKLYTGVSRSIPDNRYCTPGWSGNCYDGHDGYDFPLSYEDVLASADGVVSWAGWDPLRQHHHDGYGLYVEITHVVNGINYITRYGHLATIVVQIGQFVRGGQVIGTSGGNGNSTGPHLHFGVIEYINSMWRVIDPFGWEPQLPPDQRDVDPWTRSLDGAESWCMWSDGQYVNICDPNAASHPMSSPLYGQVSNIVQIDDTTNNTLGFNKGYGGRWNNLMSGNGHGWNEVMVNGVHSSYLTLADGGTTEDNWARWQPQNLRRGFYEIYVWIPQVYTDDRDYSFTWQAKYSIATVSGPNIAFVDEGKVPNIGDDGEGSYDPHNKWLSIGQYYLYNGSYVSLIDANGENQNFHCNIYSDNGWCRMGVDKVKFVPINTIFLPLCDNVSETNCGGDAYEPNDTFATAAQISTGNFYQTATICSLSDQDYYYFYVSTVLNPQYVDVWLENVPVGRNYALGLLDPNGSMLNLSNEPGNSNERIQQYVAVSGNYRILVYSTLGYSLTQSYRFKVTLTDAPYHEQTYPPP